MQTIQKLPTFVRTAFDEYVAQQEVRDYHAKYRSLEAVYATVIKYIGMTFGLLAADHDEDLKQEVWTHILDSSSLGGWVAAADAACRTLLKDPQVKDDVKSYCNEYSDYSGHSQKPVLDEIAEHLNVVVAELKKQGYSAQPGKSLNLIRAMEMVVLLRNRVAHGAMGPVFFNRIELPMLKALKRLMALVPFSKFVCWGKYAGHAIEFVEKPAARDRPSVPGIFWVESDLLSYALSVDVPFLTYREESRMFFFLNSAVRSDQPLGEYIDYGSGSVVYREVTRHWEQGRRSPREIRPRNYRRHAEVLSDRLAWRRIPLTMAGQQSCSDEVGVYMFSALETIGGCNVRVVLYVGKTTNLKSRVASYLRIRGKYDRSRPEISYMFDTYGSSLQLHFTTIKQSRIASVERAIYEVTMPEFNILAPPPS